MRSVFHAGLDRIVDQLVEMTRLVSSSMSRATTALLETDLEIAQSVIAADEEIAEIRRDIDGSAVQMMALQQPVATDLRILVTAVQMSSGIERMGAFSRHVAKVARLRYPDPAVPAEVRGIIQRMGEIAEAIVARAGTIIVTKDADGALALDKDDDAMDDLQRQLLAIVLADTWQHGTEAAVDLALLARYYERYADHAVSVARRVSYLVTGEWVSESQTDHEDVEERLRLASKTPRSV